MKIALIPDETAGFLQALELGFLAAGEEARLFSISDHPFNYGQMTPNPWWAEWTKSLNQRADGQKGAMYIVWFGLSVFTRFLGVLNIALRFDAVILNGGRSLLPLHADILIYRLTGLKVLAMMGHGSEIRPVCADSLGSKTDWGLEEAAKVEVRNSQRRTYSRRVERLCNHIVSTPMLAHYLRGPYLDHLMLGMPVQVPLGTSIVGGPTAEGGRHREKSM